MLIDDAVRSGFSYMLDAFHVGAQAEVSVRFFEKDFEGGSKRVVFTDTVIRNALSPEAANMVQETGSRWNLVGDHLRNQGGRRLSLL